MPASLDNDPKFAAYAHPQRLVTTQWLADHAGDPGLSSAESDEDVLLYDTAHIPGCGSKSTGTPISTTGDAGLPSRRSLRRLMSSRDHPRHAIVLTDNFNWWAAYALGYAGLFGTRRREVRRRAQRWIAEGRPARDDVPHLDPSTIRLSA